MKKVCYKGDEYNEGLTIRRVEKLGGINNHGLWGNDPGLFYFVEANGDIVSDIHIPDGYELAEEEMYTAAEIRETMLTLNIPEIQSVLKHLKRNK